MLFRRPLDQLAATPIAGTEGALAPFFSPDGRQVAFHVGGADGGTYRRVPVAGGTATAIANLPVSSPTYGTGAWGRGDLIVVSGNGEGLLRVPATGGTPQRLTAIDTAHGELAHRAPIFLRDGKTVAFQIVLGSRSRVGLVSVDARPAASGVVRHTTLDVPGVPVGDADGLLVLGRPDGTIVAVPADLRRGEVRGETVPLLDRVAWVVGPAASLGGDGSLVYLRGTSGSQLALVDEHGAAVGGLDEWRRYAHPRFSPDGRRIAVAVVPPEAGRRDLWVYDLPSGVFSRLTTGGLANRPAWTPDGRRVAYVTGGVVNEARPAEAWSVAADGSGPEERLYSMARDTLSIQELTFAPDGRAAVLRTSRSWPSGESDLWLLPLDGAAGGAGRRAVPLLRSPFNEAMPRVSPDGRWLAYISNESGRYEVYVRPFPGPGGRVQVSDGGGTEPVWAPDGRRLFYRTGDRFVAATLTSAPAAGAPAAGAPSLTVAGRRALFEGRYQSVVSVVAAPSYDVSPDGTRFAVLRPATENREVVVVLDWLAEVRARVAAARR
jgi:Tol biopolymer transport system component